MRFQRELEGITCAEFRNSRAFFTNLRITALFIDDPKLLEPDVTYYDDAWKLVSRENLTHDQVRVGGEGWGYDSTSVFFSVYKETV